MSVSSTPVQVAMVEDQPEFRVVLDRAPHELALLQLFNSGLLFKQCAELMGVSENTTLMQAARAYQKRGANNLSAAWYEARAAHLLA